MIITMEVNGVQKVVGTLSTTDNRIISSLNKVIESTTSDVHSDAMDLAPVSSGRLLRSIYIKRIQDKSGLITGLVRSSTAHSRFAEYGQGYYGATAYMASMSASGGKRPSYMSPKMNPKFPNVRKIQQWATLHGLPPGKGGKPSSAAFLIARKIMTPGKYPKRSPFGRGGIAPQPFLFPAYQKNKDKFASAATDAIRFGIGEGI